MRKKVKPYIIFESILTFFSVLLFFSSFLFSVSYFCDYLDELNAFWSIFFRQTSVLLLIVSIVSSLILFFLLKPKETKMSLMFLSIMVVISFIISYSTFYLNFNETKYDNEFGIIKKEYATFFPYRFEDSLVSFSEYHYRNTQYFASATIAGTVDDTLTCDVEYFHTKNYCLMKQFRFQSHNLFNVIDMEKNSQINASTSDGLMYKLIQSETGIKFVIENSEEAYIFSLYGDNFGEKIGTTDEFVKKAITTYKHCRTHRTGNKGDGPLCRTSPV